MLEECEDENLEGEEKEEDSNNDNKKVDAEVNHDKDADKKTKGKVQSKEEEESKRREEDIRLRMDIIEGHDLCLEENLRKIQEKYKETDEEKAQREKEMAAKVEVIKRKQSREEYQRLVSSSPGFGAQKSGFSFQKEMKSFRESIQKNEGTTSDARFVLTYGIGFITLTFLGFLSGYMIGLWYFRYDVRDSLIVSIIVGTATLMLETVLLILRIYRMQRMATMKKEKNLPSDKPLNYPRSEADILAQITRDGGIDVAGEGANTKVVRDVTLNPQAGRKGKKTSKVDAGTSQSDTTTVKSAQAKKND